MNALLRASCFTLALGVILACGKVGPPRIPQLAIPEAPEPIRVQSVDQGLEVTFRRPLAYLDGVPLDDLGSFEITRACEPGDNFVAVADIPVIDRQRFEKQGTITLVDSDVAIDQICTYRIVAITLDDYRSAPALSAPTRRNPPAEPGPTQPKP